MKNKMKVIGGRTQAKKNATSKGMKNPKAPKSP